MSAQPPDLDRDRWERVFSGLSRVEAVLSELRADMQQHIVDDVDRFQSVHSSMRRIRKALRRIGRKASQTATTYRAHWGVAAAWVSAALTVGSVSWAIYLQLIKP